MKPSLAALALFVLSLPTSALSKGLTAEDRYDACVLGAAAVYVRMAEAAATEAGKVFDETLFNPEETVANAWTACESLKPSPDADQNPEHQDFVFTALFNMFFCPRL